MINFKRLAITDLKIDIPRLAKKKVLKEALETSGACLQHGGRHVAPGCSQLSCGQGEGRAFADSIMVDGGADWQ